MKKTTQKIISVVLTAALAFGLLCIPASAAKNYPEYTSVFAIGDSNFMGYGLPGYYGREDGVHAPTWVDDQYLHFVQNSAPDLVADALGLTDNETRYAMNYPGLRAKDAYWALGGEVTDMGTDKVILNSYGAYTDPLIRDSIGENFNTVAEMQKGLPVQYPNLNDPENNNFIKNLNNVGKDGRKLVLLYAGASDVFLALSFVMDMNNLMKDGSLDVMGILGEITGKLNENYKSFLTYTPKLIEKIKETAGENYDLVIVGTFNPLKDFTISDESDIPFFDVFAAISEAMNVQYKQWAKEYGATYVDIANVETKCLTDNVNLMSILSGMDFQDIFHATPAGFAYMARQILDALEIKKNTISTNITVDLGSFKNIAFVTVGTDATPFYYYNEDTHKITIAHFSIKPTLMSVTGFNDDGSMYTLTYILFWNGRGFTARRLFCSNNLGKLLRNVLATVTGNVKSPLDSI